MIQFTNVNKKFDKKIVLQDINLSLPNGSIIGLVGPNGSGKSTILRLISGVYEADAGVVTIDDKNVYDNPQAKQKVFFLGDDPYFFSQSTIADMKHFYQIFYPDFDEARYHELVQEFELDEKTKINKFSKGMKRQVALILAIAAKPEVLLLDEAFDGLDPIMRFKLKQILTDVLLNNNSTVIISSHNLRELEDICDTIALISNHKLQFNQSTQEYRNIYHKFNLAFSAEMDEGAFTHLKPLHVSGKKQIFTLILKGDLAEIESKLKAMNPILIEKGNINLEEIFIYEVEEQKREASL